jgi:hypothetical protein
MWGWDAVALAVVSGGLLSYMAVLTMRRRREHAGLAPPQRFSTIQGPGDGRETDDGGH